MITVIGNRKIMAQCWGDSRCWGNEYGDFGRLSKMTEKIVGDQSFITQYDHDKYGNLTETTYPSDFKIKRTYNDKGFVTEIRQTDNNQLIWQRGEENALGQPKNYKMGNGKTTTCEYDGYDLPERVFTPGIQDFSYSINPQNGNMNWRKDNLKNLQENFYYDNLHRLDSIRKSNVTTLSMNYNPNGNIQKKSDAGTYNYPPFPVHGVKTIGPATQELLNSGIQEVDYTSFNKVKSIEHNHNLQLDIVYGVDNQRVRSRQYDGATLQKTKYFASGYEKEITPRSTREINYINTPCGTLAAYIKENGGGQLYYLYKDHLGSITTITNSAGTVVERRSFDAWGRLRNPDNWNYTNIPTMTLLDRGYTGHEHLLSFGLINMNGRMYDPLIGQFFSPDPYTHGIAGTQGFNRYSYCLNNPLKFTDPTGENPAILIGMAVGMIINLAVNADNIQNFGQGYAYAFVGAFSGALGGVFGAGIGVAQGAILGAASGFGAGFVAGGGNAWIAGEDIRSSLRAGLRGGMWGAAFGAVSGGIGGGIRAHRMGLKTWTGTGVGKPSFMEMPASLSEGELSGCGWAGEDINITDDIDAYFPGSKDYVSDATIGQGAYKNSTSLKGDQLHLGEKRIAGACFPEKDKIFGYVKGSIIISPNASVYAADFQAVLGHEVIHAYHFASGLMPAYGNDWSEYYAHKYSASFPSNYQNASIQAMQNYGRAQIVLYPTGPVTFSPIYPSWVPRKLFP
jgi:RHS repeat-associated protein